MLDVAAARSRTTPAQLALTRPTVSRLTCAVVGLGYVGLPTAMSLRAAGHSVIGLDTSAARIDRILRADVDLPQTQRRALESMLDEPGFDLTSTASELSRADAVIVCVPTPVDEHLLPDLHPLESAVAEVVAAAVPGQVLILTSTTYVGCTRELLVEPLRARGLEVGRDLHVAFCPERIDPGVDGHRPESTPRVVGGCTPECSRRAREVLEPTAPSLHVVASPEVAEMAKLLENTFRAVNIALANEMADVARAVGVPIEDVVDAAATKPYGFMPFRPGPGVGGHCIPCDPHYLLWQLRGTATAAPLVGLAMERIAARPHKVLSRLQEELAQRGDALAGSRVHVVGAAYKPGIEDVRESPALVVLADLIGAGAHVTFTDPRVATLEVAGRRLVGTPADVGVRPVATVVLTADPEHDLSWLDEGDLVLDATYSLAGPAEVVRL